MAKEAFNKKHKLSADPWKGLKKRLVKCFLWNMALCGGLEAFETWIANGEE